MKPAGRFTTGSKVRITKKGDGLNFHDESEVDAGSMDQELLDQDKA